MSQKKYDAKTDEKINEEQQATAKKKN